jgi:cyclopropane-fatty-acyl-phospholipid synthase
MPHGGFPSFIVVKWAATLDLAEAAVDRLLHLFLSRFIHHGSFQVTTASGRTWIFGDGAGEPIAVCFTTAAAQRAIMLDPELKIGEAFMDGTFVVEQGTIADVLAVLLSQPGIGVPAWVLPLRLLRFLFRHLQQFNPRRRAQRNVVHHYDLDGRLYALFLDADQQYSCGYFETPDQSLDDAQLAKKRHLAAKLRLERGVNVLDIGCGWGGMALYLAEMTGVNVTGITLSQEQFTSAHARAMERGQSDHVDFLLKDYREIKGCFDRIVSVGMLEHVGIDFYDIFFRRCYALLADQGIAVLHAIGRSGRPDITNPWIAKYIFRGGYIPALSEVLPAIERSGLIATDIEILQLHYAETLKAWRQRFLAHRDEAERLYDVRFTRMWEFYLACSEMAFREQGMIVFQIQMAKHKGVVPATRDYMVREEARLRTREIRKAQPLRLAGE